MQLVAVLDPRDADPLAAVVGLHEQRVADPLGDRPEVERLVVLRRHVLEARVLRRVLVRDQHGLRHLDPQPQHRAVGRVLLHRLERERAVEQVHVVHQRDLLQPLARDEVPPGEAVDHEVVARLVAQVERLDGDPLGRDAVGRAGGVLDRAEAAQQRLERARPVLLGARAGGRSGAWLSDISRTSGDGGRSGLARTASRAGTSWPHRSSSWRIPFAPSTPARRLEDSSAPVESSHMPWPQTSRMLSRERSHSRWSPPMCST